MVEHILLSFSNWIFSHDRDMDILQPSPAPLPPSLIQALCYDKVTSFMQTNRSLPPSSCESLLLICLCSQGNTHDVGEPQTYYNLVLTFEPWYTSHIHRRLESSCMMNSRPVILWQSRLSWGIYIILWFLDWMMSKNVIVGVFLDLYVFFLLGD